MNQTSEIYAAPSSPLKTEGQGQSWSPTLTQVLFSFDGRISRRTYWLKSVLIRYSVVFTAIILTCSLGKDNASLDKILHILLIPIIVIFYWTMFAGCAKRWHDRGQSGWMQLVALIPSLGRCGVWLRMAFYKATKTPTVLAHQTTHKIWEH
jgi:uncharacterized membrane protein YhaH (DUF805 family)